jgi:hypothetical protein
MATESGGPTPNNYFNSDQIYFAAKPANETAGIALSKADSFFNMLRANAYLEKLSRMWRA